jgi:hypothetical protein
MESDQKPSRWWRSWWPATALAALFIAYPLSAGPIEWLLLDRNIPHWLETGLVGFYAPVHWALHYLPDSIVDAYFQYCNWWKYG